MTTQERILGLSAFPQATYEAIDLNRLTTYVIHLLAEMNVPTSIENICVASFQLFPTKFQMCNYPTFPDMSRTNRALLQLRPKYRGWATGSVKRGFTLNGAGEETARKTALLLHTTDAVATRVAQGARQREVGDATLDGKRMLQQVRESECFIKYHAGHGTRGLDFLDMLSAYSHTPPEELRRSIRVLENVAKDESDQDVLTFLTWCRAMFAVYLEPTSTGKTTR